MNTCYKPLEGLRKIVAIQNNVRIVKIEVNHLVSFSYHQNLKT